MYELISRKMKALIKLIMILLLFLGTLEVSGQITKGEITGSWQGVLMELRLVFNISLDEKGYFNATLDSPDQGAMAIPLGEVIHTGDSLRIEAPIVNGFYRGKFLTDSTMQGEWHQSGRSFNLKLKKQAMPIVMNRPQEPAPPYPYKEEEVRFQNLEEGFALGGTLSLPDGTGPFPAVILVSGSGSQNRDEEIFGHKPFKLIADHLTRSGIAVLRYDDRGVGASKGNPAGSTTRDHAGDARSAIEFLLKRNDINHSKIGIIGHSEGAMIAFLLASSHVEISFIVSLAGPGVDGKTILLEQSDYIAGLRGAAPAVLKDNQTVMNEVYDLMIANELYETWKEEVLEFTSRYYAGKTSYAYSEEDIERGRENLIASIPGSSYAWMRYFVMFDPASLFPSIHCPVLALNGEKDCQVLAEKNISAIETGLQSAGNARTTAMILPGLNHLFQNCETGMPNEYGIIEETFDPKTLDIMSEWILQQVN